MDVVHQPNQLNEIINMSNKFSLLKGILLLLCVHCSSALAYEAPHAKTPPTIDGKGSDEAWSKADWRPIDNFIVGKATDPKDFSGRFKIVWTAERLFVLAEISDDVLLDRTADPLKQYWEDDIFEILLDEDASGGPHKSSYNAFAYHVSLDNQTVDIGENGNPRLLNDHIDSHWRRDSENGGLITWEVSIKIYNDRFSDNNNSSLPVTLKQDKVMGFMIAYCDADDPSNGRENFITSYDIDAVNGDKNRAYLDAGVFEKLRMVE